MADINPFDQFDAAPAPSANPFDQFDDGPDLPEPSLAAANASADEAMAGPEGQKLRRQLQSKANRMALDERGLGAGYAGVSAAANTALLNLPRNMIAGVKSFSKGTPFSQEYDTIKRLDEAAAEQYPRAMTAGEVGGVLAQVLSMPQAGATSALGRTIGGRALGGALTGGAMESVKTFADTKDIGQTAKQGALGAVLGAGATPLGEKVIAPLARKAGEMTGLVAPKTPIPTTEELFEKGGQAYDAAENAGVSFPQHAIKGLYDNLTRSLYNKGFTPKLQGSIKPALDELFKATIPGPSGTPSVLTFQGLETVRKIAQAAVTSPDKSTRMMGRMVKQHIDNFVNNLTPQQVASGNQPLAQAAIKDARDYWARASKSETVENALEKAGLRAASTYSGGNIDNTSRQNLRKILEQDMLTPGRWTPDEIAQINQTVRGTFAGNRARDVGNKLGPRGLMGGAELLMGISSLLHGDLPGALGMLGSAGVGYGAKGYADKVTRDSAEELLALIRSGGSRANMPGLSSGERQAGRNLAVSGDVAFAPSLPAPAPAMAEPLTPEAADVARGGIGGATPQAGAVPSDVTPSQAEAPKPNEWAQRKPEQLPYGHVFVRDKKTGHVRIFDRTRGQFVGEAAQ